MGRLNVVADRLGYVAPRGGLMRRAGPSFPFVCLAMPLLASIVALTSLASPRVSSAADAVGAAPAPSPAAMTFVPAAAPPEQAAQLERLLAGVTPTAIPLFQRFAVPAEVEPLVAVLNNPAATKGAVSSMVWPVYGWLSQGFGCTGMMMQLWSAAAGCYFHGGLDIAAAEGTAVGAVRAGQVLWAGWNDDGLGYNVGIDHGDGMVTWYGHFCCPPDVVNGQGVAQGQRIGLIGGTGASTGSHLHFVVRIDGVAIDPLGFLLV